MISKVQNNKTFRIKGNLLAVEDRWLSGIVRSMGDDRYKILLCVEKNFTGLEELVHMYRVVLSYGSDYDQKRHMMYDLDDLVKSQGGFEKGMNILLTFYRYQDETNFEIDVEKLKKRFSELVLVAREIFEMHAPAFGYSINEDNKSDSDS